MKVQVKVAKHMNIINHHSHMCITTLLQEHDRENMFSTFWLQQSSINNVKLLPGNMGVCMNMYKLFLSIIKCVVYSTVKLLINQLITKYIFGGKLRS